MMVKIGTTLVLLGCIQAASAANWVTVERPNEPHQHTFDLSKLQINGEEITYWRKVLFASLQPSKAGKVRTALFREKLDCREHTLQLLTHVLYGDDGALLEHVIASDKPQPVIPDSLGDSLAHAICPLSHKKPATVAPVTPPVNVKPAAASAPATTPGKLPAPVILQPTPPTAPAVGKLPEPVILQPTLPTAPAVGKLPEPIILPAGASIESFRPN